MLQTASHVQKGSHSVATDIMLVIHYNNVPYKSGGGGGGILIKTENNLSKQSHRTEWYNIVTISPTILFVHVSIAYRCVYRQCIILKKAVQIHVAVF